MIKFSEDNFMVDLWVEISALAVLIGLSGFFQWIRGSTCRGKKIQSSSIIQ